MYKPNIFFGTVPAACARFLGHTMKNINLPLINPCAGEFTIPQAAISAGVAPDTIWTSDISLYTSILGTLADPRWDFSELGIRFLEELPGRDSLTDNLDVAAQVCLWLKFNQLPATKLFGLNQRDEMWANWSAYRAALRVQLEALSRSLSGIHYGVRDLWQVIEATKQENAVFFASLPNVTRGYEKMFTNEGIQWNAPATPQFEPKRFEEVLAQLETRPAPSLIYRTFPELPQVPQNWQLVYSHPTKRRRFNCVLSTRGLPSRAEQAVDAKPQLFPVYDDAEIRPDSTVDVVNVDPQTALYYRDLFVHRLGAKVTARMYFLILIDGQVTTAFGLLDDQAALFKGEYIDESFGITRTSNRYHRLAKLFMLLLTSGEMRDRLLGLRKLWAQNPRGIQTTSITQHEEGKTDRSVMKVFSREKREEGGWRIVYRADWRNDTFQDCLRQWLKRWGDKKR
jgi:hypothetical protein